MRIVKPASLSVVNRPVSYSGGRVKLLVTVMAGFTYKNDMPILVSEPTVWKSLSSVLASQTVPDLGFEKPYGEWLAFGKIHPKSPTDTTAVASVEVSRQGKLLSRKKLHLSGPRTWQRRLVSYWASEPAPLLGPVPLDWQLAFGGSSHSINPQGKGQYDGEYADLQLPQIEYFDALISGTRDTPAPAGFGPLPLDAPGRFKPHGTYDANWLKNDFPSLAVDTPAEVMMMGAEDQWIKEGFLPGDKLTCEGMTDSGISVSWKIPAWSPRCYIRRADQGDRLIEAKFKLDTTWLIPHAGILAVLWRGVFDIFETDAHDVDLLFAALEDTDKPKNREHYEEQISRRSMTQKQAALAMLDDGPLLPEGQIGSLMSELSPQTKARIVAMKEQATKLKSELEAKKDNLKESAPFNPEMINQAIQDQLGEEINDILLSTQPDAAKLAELLNQASELATVSRKKSIENLQSLFTKNNLDPETAIAAFKEKNAGPPSRALQASLANLEKNYARGHLETDRFLAIKEKLLTAFQVQNATYRKTVHHLPRAGALMNPDTLGQEIVRHLDHSASANTPLAGIDWVGANLAGKNLDGKDLSGVFLDGANLEDASLVGTNLSNATLAGANLKNANLSMANLTNSNLGNANLSHANLKEASLNHAVLDKADLYQATFTGAEMKSCSFIGTNIKDANFDDAILDESKFLGLIIEKKITISHPLKKDDASNSHYLPTDFTNTSWRNASLQKVILLSVQGERANFSGANFTKASFLQCRLTSTNFSNAIFQSTNVVSESALQQCDFSNATVESSFLRGVDLSHSNFSHAKVNKTNFSLCNMNDINATGIIGGLTRFERASLENSKFTNAKLNSAAFTAAQIGLTDFTGADLTLADFTKATGNAGTRFNHAKFDYTKLDEALKD